MKFSKTILSSVVLALVSNVTASFPGTTFGIVYNSTSYLGSGHLKTFRSPKEPSPILLTTISDTTPDVGGYLTYSGTGEGYLHNACDNIGLAALIPIHDIPGLQYVLGWTTEPLATLPEGSISSGFKLGPNTTYDTLVNDRVGKGSWAVRQADASSPYLVGWSDGSDFSSSVITLAKTGVKDVTCK